MRTSIARLRCSRLLSGILAAASLAAAPLAAQGEQFQFVVSAADANGAPVTDLAPAEIVITENGVRDTILKVEPYPIPVKLTIAVDNGIFSTDAIAHYRTGLTRMLDTLPFDMETALMTTAPQSRMVVKPTTDRIALRRGMTGFAPEEARPRFTDTLVEYARRLEDEVKLRERLDYIPVLVMVSTTANEDTIYQVGEIDKAIRFLIARRARVIVTMMSTRAGTVEGDLNNNRQSLIAIPTTEATGGRYEALSLSSRLTTLLPEIGKDIAALHVKRANQMLVTARRADGLTGPIQKLDIYVTRRNTTGSVSADGFPPVVRGHQSESQ